MGTPFVPINWTCGWLLILTAFISGAWIGLYFHKNDFWGGYTSYRRRIVRLGHIALAALGMMNILFALSPWPDPTSIHSKIASISFIIGGLSMPMVCFLSGWRKPFRHLFFIPVTSLCTAVIHTLWGSWT